MLASRPHPVFPSPLIPTQGASCPPLTGKRAAGFLEKLRHSQERDAVVVSTFVPANAVVVARNSGKAASRRGRAGSIRQRGKSALARKRAGKWTEGDRDLAERELAMVIVEGQQVWFGAKSNRESGRENACYVWALRVTYPLESVHRA